MLLYIAMADAYAAAVEYVKDEALIKEALKFERYLQHPKHLGVKPGDYTDDTQQSIAVAEILLQDPPFTPYKFAEAFVDSFHRDPIDGFARGYQAFIEKTHTPDNFLKNIIPTSNKNGSGMRSVPLGVLPTPREVALVAKQQSQLTHNTPEGIYAAQAVALMSHMALYTDDSFYVIGKNITSYLDNPTWFPVQPKIGMRITSDGDGIARNTIQGVYTALTTCTTLMEMLEQIIKAKGDVDTVAALVWGIASARRGEEKIPEFMELMLKPGSLYGVSFLLDLGEKLMAKYKS
jgi:ADP-ribosyl-[dinitrogen reductase] hydrolase